MTTHAYPTENGSASATENGTRCEIKALDEKVAKSGDMELVEKPGQPYDTKLEKPFMDYALVTKRTFDEKNKHTMTSLQINSKPLLSTLKKVVKYYPSVPENFDESINIEAPFMLLYHHLEELAKFRESTEDDNAKMHIKLLLDYLDTECGDSIAQTKRLVTAGYITFPLLWTIFKPGDLVYEEECGHSRLYKLERTVYDEDKAGGKYLEVTCSHTDYDRGALGKALCKMRIYEKMEFGGPSKIDSLTVFPLRFLKDVDKECLKAVLVKRGKGFLELQTMQVTWYKGLFLGLKSPPRSYYDYETPASGYDGIWLPHTSSGRVVIDSDTFRADHKLQKAPVEHSQKDGDYPQTLSLDLHVVNAFDVPCPDPFLPDCAVDQGTSDDFMLCPSFVYGFSLDRKIWCKFFIDNIEQFEWKLNAFDSLVLPQRHKKVIRSLVNAHRFPDQALEDADPKGKGLVILLHGTPGSGKTLTAETVAEHTKKPLIIVSSGELGEWKESLEYEFKKILKLAAIWQAVVLIDEADIYLEERATTGERMERNGIVAVFLRELEYFQGVIFMTSNRVDVFDPAIKSRIHLALEYRPPGPDVRSGIWKRSLDMIPAKEVDISLEKLLKVVEKLEMNGREISNTMNTARTLSRDLGEKLNLDHIESIVQIWSTFQAATGKKEPQPWWRRIGSFLFYT